MNKEIQKQEALKRMKMLKLHPNAISEFEKEEKINYSERSFLYWLNKEMKEMIKDWEKETGNIVYHVIYNHLGFGRCLSLLYVSKNEEEWEMDREDLINDCPFVYVINIDCPDFSEYGGIGIRKVNGGILRTC